MASGGSASSASDRVRCEGFLMKHESFFFFKKEQKRYFVLKGRALTWQEQPETSEDKRSRLEINTGTLVYFVDSTSDRFEFEIANFTPIKCGHAPDKPYRLGAASSDERDMWVQRLLMHREQRDRMKGSLPSTSNSAHAAPIVFIRGATGYHAYLINGLFEPTEEKSSDGRVVYKKRGDADTIIEHFECHWQIKHASQKDSWSRYAQVGGCCDLQACKWQLSWNVLEYRDYHDQETVKMSSGAEAEAQAAEYYAAIARAAADDNSKASAVFISGATGSDAAKVNGLFEPTEEKSSDGRVVYKKRGDADTIIEHFSGDWQIKRAVQKGHSVYCCTFVRGGCALEACADRVWRVVEANAVHDRENVKMSSGAEAEAQANA